MSDLITLRASSIRSFMEVPSKWYREHILKENKFEGNTSTVLGTVVHLFAECYFTGEEFNPEMVLAECGADIDVDLIRAEYPDMCSVLENDYLSHIRAPDHIEMYNSFEKDGIKFQGTCDSINGNVLVDYKTSSKAKSKIDEYTLQLNIYAYLASLKDIEIETLRVVNVVRKTKTLPPRCIILECQADASEGKRLVELMVNKTNLALKNPEVLEFIFGDNPFSFLGDGFDVVTEVVKLEK